MGQEQWAWFGYRTGRDVDSYMNAVEDSLTKKILEERGARMGERRMQKHYHPKYRDLLKENKDWGIRSTRTGRTNLFHWEGGEYPGIWQNIVSHI